MRYDWTPERVGQLIELWPNTPVAVIAQVLGTTYASAKNKAHALKLPSKGGRRAPPTGTGLAMAGNKPRLVASNGCLWPEGDPGEPGFHFCGAKQRLGKPYCAQHAARAYVSKPKRRLANIA